MFCIHSELAVLLSMAQSNPTLFQMISDRATIARQLERLSKLKDLMETTQEELKTKQAEDWTSWITQYRWDGGKKMSELVLLARDEKEKHGKWEQRRNCIDRISFWGFFFLNVQTDRKKRKCVSRWLLFLCCTSLRECFVLSLPQETSGSWAGRPEWCAGCAGGESEGDGQHQPSRDTQKLHCPECHRGCWEWGLLWGQVLVYSNFY